MSIEFDRLFFPTIHPFINRWNLVTNLLSSNCFVLCFENLHCFTTVLYSIAIKIHTRTHICCKGQRTAKFVTPNALFGHIHNSHSIQFSTIHWWIKHTIKMNFYYHFFFWVEITSELADTVISESLNPWMSKY